VVVSLAMAPLIRLVNSAKQSMNLHIAYIVLSVLSVAASSTGLIIVATGLLVFLIVVATVSLARKYGFLPAVATVFIVLHLIGISRALLGQYVFQSGIPIWLSLLVVHALLQITISSNQRFRFRDLTYGLIVAVFVTGIGAVALSLKQSRLITYMGFGYDNYAHISVFRKIHVGQGSFVGQASEDYVAFLGSGPFGAHSAVGLIADLIGIDGGDITRSLQIFFFVSLLIPILIVVISSGIVFLNFTNKWLRVVSVLLLASTILFGWFSHLWFSGYFSSNAATLTLLLAVLISMSNLRARPKILLTTGCLVLVSYQYVVFIPLVSFILFLCVILEVYKAVKTLSENRGTRNILNGITAVVVVASSGMIYLAIHGIASGYGTGQFLQPGGIEPVPLGLSMLFLGYSATLWSGTQNDEFYDFYSSLLVFGLSIFGIGAIFYSYQKLHTVSYYPTKVLASVLIVMLPLVIGSVFKNIHWPVRLLFRGFLDVIFVLSIVIGFVSRGFNPVVFATGFMGSTTGVIRSVSTGDTKFVDGDLISKSIIESERLDKPALLLLSKHESELNTRWVNSLTFRWSDASWEDWMTARDQLYINKDFETAKKIISGDPTVSKSSKGLVVVTDDRDIIALLWSNDPVTSVCEVVKQTTLLCNS